MGINSRRAFSQLSPTRQTNDSYPCLFTSIFLNRREMESNRVCGKFTVLLCQIPSSSRCSTRNSETKNNLSVPRNKSHHKYHRACVCRIYSQPKTAKTSRRVEIRNLCLVSSSNRSCWNCLLPFLSSRLCSLSPPRSRKEIPVLRVQREINLEDLLFARKTQPWPRPRVTLDLISWPKLYQLPSVFLLALSFFPLVCPPRLHSSRNSNGITRGLKMQAPSRIPG